MALSVVEVLVDDLDGSEATESVRIGWNGEWRQIELNDKNRVALHKALDKFWQKARPVKGEGTKAKYKPKSAYRDTTAIRQWAAEHGVACPARGRVPAAVEAQYLAAGGR
jgi:nucleoid-associated protein Lsr2